jgi:hypothetical protein
MTTQSVSGRHGARPRHTLVSALLITWLAVAAWDFVCASALSVLAYGTPFSRLWQGVAATVLSLVVIPLATGSPPRFGLRWWVQVFAHVPFVTLPLVFTARHTLGLSLGGDVMEL